MWPDSYSSRRSFLNRGAALLAAGVGVPGLSRLSRGDSSRAKRQVAVACLRREAGEAARDVLRAGGNAIDATVAALLVEYVNEPSNVGLGGYGGSLVFYQAKSGRVRAIDCDSRAPKKFDPNTFNAKSANHGYLAVGVPGNAAGIDLALREFGTMPFRKLATPAIELAEGGITVPPRLSMAFCKLVDDIDPVSRRAFFPDGVPAQGTVWKQPDLARLLRRLGDEGLESFYKGEVAAAICKQVQANGGSLAEDDFHEFAAQVVEPLRITYRGYEVFTPPLPSGGLTSLSVLKTLENFDLAKFERWDARYYNLLLNALHLAWDERKAHFGDPEFVKVPVEELLSEKNAAKNAAEVRKGLQAPPGKKEDASHTVNVVCADAEGNVVSWTSTHGGDFGSHVAIEGLGLMLGHGMSRFDVDPKSPNYPAARKRPQHNMSPTVVLRDDKPYAGLGLPGGTKIVTVTAQMLVNLLDYNMEPELVVSGPRVHTEETNEVIATTSMPAAAIEGLKKLGHEVKLAESVGGEANVILLDAKSGRLQAAAGPNSDGVVVE